ncbi:MAG: hypothetical protein E7235_05755 [Lachnospiraceae bacterium]|nr:hypothetical protein [Lachnospiraceae bacterium]
MIKRLLPIICAVILLLSGCTDKASEDSVITTSFYPVYLTAINITKNTDTEITTLAKPSTGCLHDYQLTSGDIRKLNDSALFIINGAGMEDGFIGEVINSNDNIDVLDSSYGTHAIENTEECADEHSHEEHDHSHAMNSHIWLMPHNVIRQAENITQKLREIYPDNSDVYNVNLNDYTKKLKELDEAYEKLYIDKDIKAIILNDGFEYLCTPYGIEVAFTIELDENTTTSAKELASITDSARNGSYIIMAPKGEHSAFAASLSRELGIPVFELDPITYGELENHNYYIEAMEYNYSVLKEISDL